MKFLFTTNPLMGHFLPMVPLIRAARAAGHEVIVATGSDLRDAVRRHGFPLWLVGPRFAEVRAELAGVRRHRRPDQDRAAAPPHRPLRPARRASGPAS